MSRMRVLIAGGGVGGLALAMALRARGIGCMVFEAAREVRELGVGINILPHAIAELAKLDLLDDLDAVAIRTRTLTYMNRLGQEIWTEPRGMHAGHPVPQFSIHRGRLHGVLWRAAQARLPRGTLRPGHRLLAVRQHPNSVTASFETPSGEIIRARGDVLIGCDGIHSALRSLLHPEDGGIRWSGIRMWRGAVDWPAWRGGEAMLVAGDMAEKLIFYPIANGASPDTRLTNWVICVRDGDGSTPPPGRQDWSRRGSLEELLPHVRRFAIPGLDVEALIRATPENWEYPMADRDPLPWWTQGRVTLMGDAAHPMYPVGSNGASQAVLDAISLADHLASHQPAPAALAAYEAQRRPATTALVHSNRQGGPERVLDAVGARAPDGFARLEDVIAREELAAIGGQYAAMAGFAR
jgi:2-polyprenyl-6-methoxyphenol hydroxylase-like FAD-dependent oxidoreductase